MSINSRNPAGMFKLNIFGAESKELRIFPDKILGTQVPGLEELCFTTRVEAKDIKFFDNRNENCLPHKNFPFFSLLIIPLKKNFFFLSLTSLPLLNPKFK